MEHKIGHRMPHRNWKVRRSVAVIAVMLSLATMLSGCNADAEQIAKLVGAMAENPQKTQEIVEEAAAAENESADGKNESDAAAENESADGKKESDTAAGKTEGEDEDKPALPEKDIYIVCTSDVHCAVDQGFGYVGLAQIVSDLKARGCEVILVDNGDHVQGEPIGAISKGEDIIPIMNALGYDISIPGNHEFDFGLDELFRCVELADFPCICCNFVKDGKPVFDPYLIKEAGGKKIAFVGVTTPKIFASEAPKRFQDENGNYIYGFMQGDGSQLYACVQDSVDAAIAEGADYVYLMSHLGNMEDLAPYSCMDVIENTTGIDVVLDGHSHDLDKMVIKNKDGEDVTRIACGYKFSGIGYSHIKAKDGTTDTGIWVWDNGESVPELFGMRNEITDVLDDAKAKVIKQINQVVARTDVSLLINEPGMLDKDGYPVLMVRHRETNLGDLCADAIRIRTGADIGIVNGGGLRADMGKGDITYGDIINVNPYGNETVVLEVTGQQIADALEWSCRAVPDDEGAFLQVSGMTFKIDTKIKSGCIEDENRMMAGFDGQRRVSDIKIGDKPLDPKKKYTIAGNEFILCENGSGYTSFDDATVAVENAGQDYQILIDYIVDDLGGVIGKDYSDPYGQGRIVIE